MINSIANRIVITALALVLVTAATIGAIQYFDFKSDQGLKHSQRLPWVVEARAKYYHDVIEETRRNALFLAATPPISGIFRSQANYGIDPVDASTEEVWKNRLCQIFESMARLHPEYLQVRFIGVAGNGHEIVRVDSRSGLTKCSSEVSLQAKGSSNYFQDTITLPENATYISDITLNREHDRIELPFIPVQRIATPVYTTDGDAFGVVVINLNMQSILSRMTANTPKSIQILVANKDGEYIANPDSSKTFGFEFGKSFSLKADFADLDAFIADKDRHEFSGTLAMPTGDQIAHFKKIYFNSISDSAYLVAGALSPEDLLFAEIGKTRERIMIVTLALALAAGAIAFASARVIVKPLEDLKIAAQKLESGVSIADVDRPRVTTSEISVLSQSFFSMASALSDRESVLAEKEARIRAILDTAVSPIITLDSDGFILSANPATTDLLGYANTRLVGLNVAEILPGSTVRARGAGAAGISAQDFVSPAYTSQEIEVRTKVGKSIPVHLSVSKVQLHSSVLFTVILTDIREQKKLVSLNTALAEQKRVDKLKDEFISTVSHELRTPLTSIMGSLGLVRSGTFGVLPDKALQLLQMAESNGQRLVALINDILDVEKMESGSFSFSLELYSLNVLIEDSVAAADGYAIKHGVRLSASLLPDDVFINVDEARFMQIMQNLLSNAIKFSDTAGTVSVFLENLGGRVRISVQDQGRGIAMEIRDQVFNRFTQGDSSSTRSADGTGLGLSIAKGLVEKFGGSIGFETATGKGTTFHFDLPVHQEDKAVASAS